MEELSRIQSKKGFTLIELLVVIAIIGILSAIGLVSLAGAREKARDSRRKSDLATLSTALQLYVDDNSANAFPSTATGAGTADVASNNLAVLVPKYLNALPPAPSDINGPGDYWYRTNGTNSTILIPPLTGKNYAAQTLFWLATKLESGPKYWYLINNVGFGGEVNAGAGTIPASAINITCDGETSASGKIDGCSRSPSND